MIGLSANDFEFAREFAIFANYVGADDLHKAARKVQHKLDLLDDAPRKLFGTRYFFHESIVEFTDGRTPFRLDLSDPLSVRAATFIAGVNRAKSEMSPIASVRFRRMVVENLKPDRDFRQVEHEIRCYIHLRHKHTDVQFVDLNDAGKFDFFCTPGSIEVECKTISEDTGNPIKIELIVNLTQHFLKLEPDAFRFTHSLNFENSWHIRPV
jgi:hypothetical protein